MSKGIPYKTEDERRTAIRESRRRWHEKHPYKYDKERDYSPRRQRQHTSRKLLKSFGITLEQYEEMFLAQGGVCAVCHEAETAGKNGKPFRLAVDHDHETGKIRQLLCMRCNFMLGHIENNKLLLEALQAYIKKHKQTTKRMFL